MAELVVNIPVKSFKKFEDPYDSRSNPPAKYQFFCNVHDVPADWDNWFDVNPREQNIKTMVAKAIKDSLISDNQNFHLLNRGMLVAAKSVTFDNKTQSATIIFDDHTQHGIIDGGHTFKQICKFNETNYSTCDKYVQIEIMTNVDNITDLAEARNKSVPVDTKSLEELSGSFDVLKSTYEHKLIQGNDYSKRIIYKQNEVLDNDDTDISEEDKIVSIDIRDIVAIINMFNLVLYPNDTNNHPQASYTTKENSLIKFLKMGSKNYNRAKRDKVILDMRNIIPDIFLLWDTIETEFVSVVKDIGKKYGSISYSNYNNNKIKKYSTFSNKKMEYTIPKGIMYPILGAFRALVEVKDDGTYGWSINPLEVWKNLKNTMVNTVIDTSISVGHSPDRIGKNTLLWNSLYQSVKMYYFEQTIKNTRKG